MDPFSCQRNSGNGIYALSLRFPSRMIISCGVSASDDLIHGNLGVNVGGAFPVVESCRESVKGKEGVERKK